MLGSSCLFVQTAECGSRLLGSGPISRRVAEVVYGGPHDGAPGTRAKQVTSPSQILPKIQPSPATEMSLAAGKTGPAELPLLTRETGGLTPTVVNSNNSELIPTFTLIEKVEKCNSPDLYG